MDVEFLYSPEAMTDWTGIWSYGYDENNRLTSAAPPNPVPDQPAGGIYGYDWVGNRLNPPYGDNAMVYNAADQLTSWPGMYSYSYYGDGSLEEVRNEQGAFVSRYTYHPNGLLNQASYMGNRTATNVWDANSNRVGLTINGKVCSFVYDPTAGIPAVIEEVVDGTPVYYYREPGGTLMARTDAINGIRYYHFDALGSTRLLTDGDGDITDKYAYDAWGTVVAHDRYEGSVDQPYQYVGMLGYYTHYQDPDFKLLQLGVRFYDSDTSRFTSRDPIKDGLNWYGYVEGKPLIVNDPNGLHGLYNGPGLTDDDWDSLFDGRSLVDWWNSQETQELFSDIGGLTYGIGKALVNYFIPYEELMDLPFRWSKCSSLWSKLRILKNLGKEFLKVLNVIQLLSDVQEAAYQHPKAGWVLWPLGPLSPNDEPSKPRDLFEWR